MKAAVRPVLFQAPCRTAARWLGRLARWLAQPARILWRNLQQGPARLPDELIEKGPRIRASALYGGMGERELQLRMEQTVDRILSSRRSVHQPAKELAAFNQVEQRRFLEAAKVLADSDAELAYRFLHLAIPSLHALDENQWDGWIDHLRACYDRLGVDGAVQAMQQVQDYLRDVMGAPQGIRLADVAPLVEMLLAGFGGRPMQVEAAAEPYTDTATIYLPERLDACSTREANFELLKATVAHLWAQTRYGTYRTPPGALSGYPDPARARRCFHALEMLRLDARIRRDMPGLGRILERHNPPAAWRRLSPVWAAASERLARPQASVEDSLQWVRKVYGEPADLPSVPYQGRLRPELAAEAMAQRIEEERRQLSVALRSLSRELSPFEVAREEAQRFTVRRSNDRVADEFAFSLEFGEEPVTPPAEVRQLLESIMQDLGEVPDAYLEPAGAGAYAEPAAERDIPVEAGDAPHFVYPEWDHSRQKYRADWCRLYERPIAGSSEEFAQQVLQRHRRLLAGLRRTFEALRDEEKRIRREPHGDEVDLDSFVDAYSGFLNGAEMDERLFTRMKKTDRDIAVMFLVDMSGSTSGWINDLVREALVLLCSALEALGDRYAIYGFSGRTHRNCELYPIKALDEPYGPEVRRRISGITPRNYTRMGAMIRHLTHLLGRAEARTRLLITLSDGKPDDQDGYRGAYGIEDTRQALHEARHLGIHPYCITIDDEAMEYLPHMYGAANFAVVSQIGKLPLKVSDIYRRITL